MSDDNPDARAAAQQLVAEKMAAGEPYAIRFKVPSGKVLWIDDYVRGRVNWRSCLLLCWSGLAKFA